MASLNVSRHCRLGGAGEVADLAHVFGVDHGQLRHVSHTIFGDLKQSFHSCIWETWQARNYFPIPLTHFWIRATCGENKYLYLVSCIPPGNRFFFAQKSLTGRWEVIFDQPNFQEGYKIEVFIFTTGGSTCHILAFWRKGMGWNWSSTFLPPSWVEMCALTVTNVLPL